MKETMDKIMEQINDAPILDQVLRNGEVFKEAKIVHYKGERYFVANKESENVRFDRLENVFSKKMIEQLYDMDGAIVDTEETATLIDAVTSCCGYDFGLDEENANFCPVCGRSIIKGFERR